MPKLQALGAEVLLVRQALEPVTTDRPETLRAAGRAELAKLGVKAPRETYDGMSDPRRGQTVQAQSELLFYRISEIRHRAEVVNETLQPDLVLCLHFNAEGWGDPNRPDFVPRNHLHVLVNGCYAASELRLDDQRFEMLMKLLSRSYPEEFGGLGNGGGRAGGATKLPAYEYTTGNAIRTGTNPFVWARNLLANRLYHAPVVFLEPYVMNSELVWARVQAGDYDGEYLLGGELRRSIYREYADSVVAGLKAYYEKTRVKPPGTAP